MFFVHSQFECKHVFGVKPFPSWFLLWRSFSLLNRNLLMDGFDLIFIIKILNFKLTMERNKKEKNPQNLTILCLSLEDVLITCKLINYSLFIVSTFEECVLWVDFSVVFFFHFPGSLTSWQLVLA